MSAKPTTDTSWYANPVDKTSQTDDQRIKDITVLPPPEHLIRFFPIAGTAVERLITDTRRRIHNIMSGKDDRLLVIIGSLVLMAYGAFTLSRTPVDVFPDLNKPTVTVITEAGGMAAEEVEQLITFPLETALSGTCTSPLRQPSSTSGEISKSSSLRRCDSCWRGTRVVNTSLHCTGRRPCAMAMFDTLLTKYAYPSSAV
jgi:hypothetical protein